MLDSLDELRQLFSGCTIEIRELGDLIDEIEAEIEDLEDYVGIDENEQLWVTAFKSFYKKVCCYHATVLVSEQHIVDYFMEYAYALLDECPVAVKEFVSVSALANYLINDLTVIEIKYPSWHVDAESWYLI